MTKAKRNTYMAKYRVRHREQIREYDRRFRIRRGGRVRAPVIVCRACGSESPNNINGTKKFCSKSCFRKAFRPHKNAWNRAWYKLNRERLLLWQRTYYADTRGIYQRRYYEKNRARHLTLSKLWSEKNWDTLRVKNKRKVDELADDYVKSILKLGCILRREDFPPEIVELKRKQIRLLRAIKQRKVNTCTLNTSAA